MKNLILKNLSLAIVFCLTQFYSCGIGGGVDYLDPSAGGPLSDSLMLQYKDCQKDEDCIWVKNGCCDCANGGKDDAINEDRYLDFQDNFDCTNVTCTMMEANPPCGSGTVTCRSGKCEYTAFDLDLPDPEPEII
jgi:hypothetical protein